MSRKNSLEQKKIERKNNMKDKYLQSLLFLLEDHKAAQKMYDEGTRHWIREDGFIWGIKIAIEEYMGYLEENGVFRGENNENYN